MTAAAPVRPGEVVDLGPRVRRLTAPNPGLMTGPGTNTYLVGVEDVAVIDPGPADDAHLDAIVAAGDGRIRCIVVTHTHVDHSTGVAGLKERTDATIFGFGPDDGFEPDRALRGGDRVGLRDATLEAVHTPGHASNHLCFLLLEDRLLFSGDHVMQGSTVVIRPPDGDMAVYLDSLRRVRSLAPAAIAPGHGTLIDDPAAAIDGYLAHRLERERQVLAAVRRGLATVDAIVRSLYADVRDELHPVARQTVHAHLLKLAAEGAVAGDDADGRWDPVAIAR